MKPDQIAVYAFTLAAAAGRNKATKVFFLACISAAITIASASETDPRKIELKNGYSLHIAGTTYSRTMPWAFYDQAIESIPRIHPNSIIVTRERLGITGENNEVIYSMVGYKVSKNAKVVTVSGIVTIGEQAWLFNIEVPESSITRTLQLILQELYLLPGNKLIRQDLSNDQAADG